MQADHHHEIEVTINRRREIRRRDFIRVTAAGAAASGWCTWPDLIKANADTLRKHNMACILLWMQGGPSQFETLSPKPGHANGGDTKAISTRVPGIQIAENLPQLSQVIDDVCIVRSMTSREGSHPRASFLLHTGYLPTASVKYPALGSHVAQQLGDAAQELPSFVRIGRSQSASGGGFLGVEYDPLVIGDPRRVPDNSEPSTAAARYRRRLRLMGRLENHYAQHGGRQDVADHRKLYEKAAKMVLSPDMTAFDIEREPATVRESYGESQFAAGCLLARRLVEAGVTFVEVSSGNWDTHFDNSERTGELCGQIDRPYAELLRDLKRRGMLERTLVIWMGEFGRTPRINARGGRDHYPRAFSMALAGGGVRGGQVIGQTDAGGVDVVDRPVTVVDLFQTFCQGLGINADHENMSGIGRPIKIVDGGKPVNEVFG